jgi:hypothetical protein
MRHEPRYSVWFKKDYDREWKRPYAIQAIWIHDVLMIRCNRNRQWIRVVYKANNGDLFIRWYGTCIRIKLRVKAGRRVWRA